VAYTRAEWQVFKHRKVPVRPLQRGRLISVFPDTHSSGIPPQEPFAEICLYIRSILYGKPAPCNKPVLSNSGERTILREETIAHKTDVLSLEYVAVNATV